MPSSRWLNVVRTSICSPLAAAAIVLSLASPGLASINQAGAVTSPPAVSRCSGAFRYAARVGNDDIVEVSPVTAFAKDRRLSRMRYAGRGMSDAEPAVSRLIVLTAMCGAR
jgi:hypothetical protein